MSSEEYITLISAEDFEYIISKKAAMNSKLLQGMVEDESGPFSCSEKIPLYDISSETLERVCQYLNEKEENTSIINFLPLLSLDSKTKEGKEAIVELLLAANYLDC
eukprot:gene11253-4072_t